MKKLILGLIVVGLFGAWGCQSETIAVDGKEQGGAIKERTPDGKIVEGGGGAPAKVSTE